MPSPFLHALDREWASISSTPAARRALMRWSARRTELAGAGSLTELLELRCDPEQSASMLGALAALAPSDDLAARTLLQAMLPGLVRLSRAIGSDDPCSMQELASIAWERIRTYPPGREGSVAGNVLLDVRKRYRQHRRIEEPGASEQLSAELVDRGCSTEDVALGRLRLAEVVDASRNGIVSPSVMRWIIRTRLLGEAIEDVAAEEDIPQRTLCQRRWRAQTRLRDLELAG